MRLKRDAAATDQNAGDEKIMTGSGLRTATEKEKAVIAAFRTPTILSMGFFFLCGVLMAGILIVLSFRQIMQPVFGFIAAPAILLICGHFLRIGLTASRDVSALLVMDTEGRIKKVIRGKGGLVAAICLARTRYNVMDGEPVSEGTMVRISYLPKTRRIVTLERIYNIEAPTGIDDRCRS